MSFRPGDGGKGSGRRPGTGYAEGFDRIFGAKAKPSASVGVNIRHDLDPTLVAAAVEAKIASHESGRVHSKNMNKETLKSYERAKAEGMASRWPKPPSDGAHIDPMYDDWIKKEREYYSHVRVIELPQPGKRFILVYGDQNDVTVKSGTGPFESLEKAADWFYKGGR